MSIIDQIIINIDQLRNNFREAKILKFLEKEGKASSWWIAFKTGIHGVHVDYRLRYLQATGKVQEHDSEWSLRS